VVGDMGSRPPSRGGSVHSMQGGDRPPNPLHTHGSGLSSSGLWGAPPLPRQPVSNFGGESSSHESLHPHPTLSHSRL